MLCIFLNPFKEPGASQMATDRPDFFVKTCISHFGIGNQWTSDGMSGPLCAVVNITKQGNLNNNPVHSTTLGSQETSDSNQAEKNKNLDNSISKVHTKDKFGKSCQGSLTILQCFDFIPRTNRN